MTGVVGLIARREVTSRLQQRGFRLGFLAALVIVVLAVVVPAFFSGDDKPTKYDVGVTDAGLAAGLTAQGKEGNPGFTVHRAAADTAEKRVRDGDWDAAILPGGKLVAGKTSDDVVGVVQGAYQRVILIRNLQRANLSPDQIERALTLEPLAVRGTESSTDNQRQAIAIVTVIALFSQLITFCTWVAMGVVEEKASRVVELVLSSVRPLQLLAGKLIGIGTLASAQVLCLGVAALVGGTLAGTITIPLSAVAVVLVAFVGFVLGFAFFAALAAGMASTVSRQEEVSGVLTPVTLSLTVCYFASFATTSDPDGTLARVLSVVPPVSCIAMPGRIAHGDVPVLDVVLAVVLLVVAAAGVIAVAARVYRATVLHGGTRVPLSRAWRGEAVADIA